MNLRRVSWLLRQNIMTAANPDRVDEVFMQMIDKFGNAPFERR